MRKLILTSDNGAREFPVGKGVTIGRNGGNTIQLEGSKIEPNHAKIAPKGNLLFVEDLDTPYGITVNGKKVTRWSLNKGDVIEIGSATLRYEEDDQPEPAPAKPAAPATKPAMAPASKTAPKGSAAQVQPAVVKSAAPAKPAAAASPAKPAAGSSAKAPSNPAPKAHESPKTVVPSAAAKKPGSGLRAAVPNPAHEKSASERAVPKSGSAASSMQNPNSSVRIKLGGDARNLLSDLPPDAPGRSTARPSMSKISLAGNVLDESSSRKTGSGASGVMPSLGSGRHPAGQSERIKLDHTKEIQSKALRAKDAHTREDLVLVKPMSRGTKIAATAVVAVLILAGVSAAIYPAIRDWMARSSAEKEIKQVVDEAVERLRQPGPKERTDLATVSQKLRKANTWADVEDILGTPDYQSKDAIQLFNGELGVYELKGHAFKAYYIKDALYPNPKEGDRAPILLFMLGLHEEVSFIEGDRYLARSANLAADRPKTQPTTIPTTTSPNQATKSETPVVMPPPMTMPTPEDTTPPPTDSKEK